MEGGREREGLNHFLKSFFESETVVVVFVIRRCTGVCVRGQRDTTLRDTTFLFFFVVSLKNGGFEDTLLY